MKINREKNNFNKLWENGFLEIENKIQIIYLSSALQKIFDYWKNDNQTSLDEWLNHLGTKRYMDLQKPKFKKVIEKYMNDPEKWNPNISIAIFIIKSSNKEKTQLPEKIENKNIWRKNMKDFLRESVDIKIGREGNTIKIKNATEYKNKTNEILEKLL